VEEGNKGKTGWVDCVPSHLVPLCGEARQTLVEDVGAQRLKGRDGHIQADVEFVAVDKQRPRYVSRRGQGNRLGERGCGGWPGCGRA
jgi:hypothetical protein